MSNDPLKPLGLADLPDAANAKFQQAADMLKQKARELDAKEAAQNNRRRSAVNIVIISGRKDEAERYINHSNISPFDFTIIANAAMLQAVEGPIDVVLAGSWTRRSDLPELLDVLKARHVTEILQASNDPSRGGNSVDAQIDPRSAAGIAHAVLTSAHRANRIP